MMQINNLNNISNNQNNNNVKNNKNNISNKNFTSILTEKSSEKDSNTNIKQTETNTVNAAELMFNNSKINKIPIVKSGIERDIEIAKNALKNVPDIREDKVKELSEKIKSGTYEVSIDDFVNKLIDKKI